VATEEGWVFANPRTNRPYYPTEIQKRQELMQHASIQTTMNVYGQAMSSSKREANGKVVEMVLKPVLASA
jgi:integrase